MMRRAMGKKKREEMARHEEKFILGAIGNGIQKEKAEEIFKLMAQFADYGFNRSHSVAYAYLAFQTAYLKAHYPAYFYASVLSHESQDSAKVHKYSKELRFAGLDLLPPDINESDEGFTPLDGAVRFGLTAIKGIGISSVQAIIEARKKGLFGTIVDFVERLGQGALNRKGFESLVMAGAFDSIKPEGITLYCWRSRLFSGTEAILSHGQKIRNDRLKGQSELFGGLDEGFQRDWRDVLPDVPDWTIAEVSKNEKNAVGFFLSTHPLDEFQSIVEDLKIKNISDFGDAISGSKINVAGIVSGAQVRYSKKGNRFCIFHLEDLTGNLKCLVWSESYQKYSGLLKDDEILLIEGRVEANEGTEITIIVDQVKKIAEAVPQMAQVLNLTLSKEHLNDNFLEEMLTLLSREQGRCEVCIGFNLGDNCYVNVISEPLRIKGSSQIEEYLRKQGCQVQWVL
jgi:DNA polymerase-3 subunit alpha